MLRYMVKNTYKYKIAILNDNMILTQVDKKKISAAWDSFGKYYVFYGAECKDDLHFPSSCTVICKICGV